MNTALEESRDHWQDTVNILEKYKGASYLLGSNSQTIVIDETLALMVSFDTEHCACCQEYSCFSTEINTCPLEKHGYGCMVFDSPWNWFAAYADKSYVIDNELIKRAKYMLNAVIDTIKKEEEK